MKLGLYKGQVTESMKDDIYSMTINGVSARLIGIKLGICRQTVRSHRKKMNIDADNGLGFTY